VREHVASVTRPEPVTVHPEPDRVTEIRPAVTESRDVTEIPVEVTEKRRGRPRKIGALTNAERQRAYRERRAGS